MEDMEAKLGQLLSDPQMMGRILSFAQSLGGTEESPPAPPQEMPVIDPAALQKLTSMLGSTGVDRHQQALLQALTPYLSHQRVSKLEKAMRAAKIAGMASSFLGEGLLFSGR